MRVMGGPMVRTATIGDADLAFKCGMLARRSSAIVMAKAELAMGKDEVSRALAEANIVAQKKGNCRHDRQIRSPAEVTVPV